MALIRSEDLMPGVVSRSFELIDQHLSSSIGGLYVLSDGRVEHRASCVFVRCRGVDYIVTATHVLTNNRDMPLIVGCSSGSGSFGGEFRFPRDEDLLDVAIARMPASLKMKLPEASFYDIDHAISQPLDWSPERCVIFGLPNTKNRRDPGKLVPSSRGVFGFLTVPAAEQKVANHPKIRRGVHLVLDWTGKQVVTVDGERRNPPSLVGTSGGAVIDLGYLDDLTVLATGQPPMPRIQGIVSLWVGKKLVVGVRFSAMIAALDQMQAWPT